MGIKQFCDRCDKETTENVVNRYQAKVQSTDGWTITYSLTHTQSSGMILCPACGEELLGGFLARVKREQTPEMEFSVYHMRNYQEFYETEDSVEGALKVRTSCLEEEIRKLMKAYAWDKKHDWIRIELTNEEPYFDSTSELYLWKEKERNAL